MPETVLNHPWPDCLCLLVLQGSAQQNNYKLETLLFSYFHFHFPLFYILSWSRWKQKKTRHTSQAGSSLNLLHPPFSQARASQVSIAAGSDLISTMFPLRLWQVDLCNYCCICLPATNNLKNYYRSGFKTLKAFHFSWCHRCLPANSSSVDCVYQPAACLSFTQKFKR